MMKVVLILSLFALCFAQERPNFPATFFGEYESELLYLDQNGVERMSGSGKRAYDQEKNMGMHYSSYSSSDSEPGIMVEHYSLERFDMNIEFSYDKSSDHPFVKCNTEEIYGDLYPYFDWVQYAEYDGSRTMGEEPIEFWKIEVGADTHAVGVRADQPNIPVYYMHHHEYRNRTTYEKYTLFNAETPRETDFEIPEICQRMKN